MTLVITVVTHHGLWQSTDHQLTQVGAEALPDPSVKHIYLEAEDGKALIAYAGIGKVRNMQISEWVRSVLHGRKRNLVSHMSVLREAANRKLLPISKATGTPHTFSIAAYENSQPTLYLITNCVLQDGKYIPGNIFDWRRLVLKDTHYKEAINVEGQGALALSGIEDRKMLIRTIRQRVKKPSFGKDVAVTMAYLNMKASKDQRSNGSVSQNCMVTHLASSTDGSVHWYFGWDTAAEKPILQTVMGGFDVTNIIETLLPLSEPILKKQLEALQKGEQCDEEVDTEVLNEALRRNYKKPSDEFE